MNATGRAPEGALSPSGLGHVDPTGSRQFIRAVKLWRETLTRVAEAAWDYQRPGVVTGSLSRGDSSPDPDGSPPHPGHWRTGPRLPGSGGTIN